MGKYKPYPEYKDSGVEWLGDVPGHWELVRTKNLLKREQRAIRDSDGIVTAFRDGEVTLRSKRRTQGFTNALKEIGYQGVRVGDLLVHAMDGFAGAIGVSDSEGKCSPVCSVCTPICSERVVTNYYGRLLRHMAISGYITALAKGIRERSTEFRYNELQELWVVCPSKTEQTRIAAFLDYETAKIDRLIEKQEKLIELLKEKRQAVVSHAVTKGLNLDAPMKDSGIEWLGEVPEHWKISELRHHTKWLGGGTPSKDKLVYWDGDIPWVSPKDMKVECIEKTLDQITEQAVAESSVIKIPKDNILIVVRGMILARTVPVAIAGCNLTINQDMKALLPAQNLLGKFLLYYLLGSRQRLFDLVEEAAHGTKCLRTELARRLEIVIPPLAEQSALILEIEKRRIRLSDLINKAGDAIQLLKERRTALISAAVTGKIDVRGWNKD